MFKLSVFIALFALVCSAYAKPAVVAAAVPTGVVTATSSQYIARNYNGIAAAPVVAAAYTAPVAAAAYTAPVAAAYTAPVATAAYAAPYTAAYAAPYAAAYAAPYAAAYTAGYAPAAYTTVF
uniref:Cuticle protein n=1 Tax=Musca domestica TaxID=7370 RepID=A0A1I8MJM3_MUSDO